MGRAPIYIIRLVYESSRKEGLCPLYPYALAVW